MSLNNCSSFCITKTNLALLMHYLPFASKNSRRLHNRIVSKYTQFQFLDIYLTQGIKSKIQNLNLINHSFDQVFNQFKMISTTTS